MRPSKDIDTLKHRTRIDRILMFVVLLLLSIQLMGAASHKHALADTKSDCAACYFAHHQPAGLPPVAIDAVPVSALVSYLPIGLVTYLFMAQPSYLIPLAQAPPHQLPTY
jgi:hypothetical protein